MNSVDRQVYSVCILQFSFFLLNTTVCSQHINKQNVNIADETLSAFLIGNRYHYTKSKNYLKRRYRIRHWIPMFIGTPCSICKFSNVAVNFRNRIRRLQTWFLNSTQLSNYWNANYCTSTCRRGGGLTAEREEVTKY